VIVDTSAVMAILLVERDARTFADALAEALRPRMSAATYVELVNVCDRRLGSAAIPTADELIKRARLEIEPFTVEQAQWARHARLTYGVGRHRANLNFGDCFVYALAKSTGEPLLFKGDDFVHTDIVSAI
jgi:ribonuclease VapC